MRVCSPPPSPTRSLPVLTTPMSAQVWFKRRSFFLRNKNSVGVTPTEFLSSPQPYRRIPKDNIAARINVSRPQARNLLIVRGLVLHVRGIKHWGQFGGKLGISPVQKLK